MLFLCRLRLYFALYGVFTACAVLLTVWKSKRLKTANKRLRNQAQSTSAREKGRGEPA